MRYESFTKGCPHNWTHLVPTVQFPAEHHTYGSPLCKAPKQSIVASAASAQGGTRAPVVDVAARESDNDVNGEGLPQRLQHDVREPAIAVAVPVHQHRQCAPQPEDCACEAAIDIREGRLCSPCQQQRGTKCVLSSITAARITSAGALSRRQQTGMRGCAQPHWRGG